MSAFIDSFHTDPTLVFLIGRSISALAGTISIGFSYAIGRRLFGTRSGLFGALFLASAPMAVRHSCLIRTDALALSLILAAVYLSLRYLKEGRGWGWAAAFLVGLATATKYTSLMALAPVLVAGLWAPGPGPRLRRVLLLPLAAAAGLFVGAPYVVLDAPAAWADLVKQWEMAVRPYSYLSPGSKAIWYLTQVIPTAFGSSLIPILALAGLFFLRISRRTSAVLFCFPLFYLALVLSSRYNRFSRYMLYLLPFICLLAGLCLDRALAWISLSRRPAALVAVGLGLLVVFPSLEGVSQLDIWGNRIDLRTTAQQWMESHIPDGAAIAYETGCPLLHHRNTGNWELLNLKAQSVASRPLEHYREAGINYLLLCRRSRLRTWKAAMPTRRRRRFKKVYAEIDRLPLLASFGDQTWSKIEVYELQPVPAQE